MQRGRGEEGDGPGRAGHHGRPRRALEMNVLVSTLKNFRRFFFHVALPTILPSHACLFVLYFERSMKEGRKEMSLCAEDMSERTGGPSNRMIW